MSNKKPELKASVRVATHENSIDNLQEAPLVIDSIAINKGDRILVKNGASLDGIEPVSAKRNGIYEVKQVDAFSAKLKRAKDANKPKEVKAGMFTFIQEGDVNADTGWILITDNPIDLEETELTFVQFTNSGEVSNDVQSLINRNADNIALNAFRLENQDAITLEGMVKGSVDNYENEDKVDNTASLNELYNATEDVYQTQDEEVKLLLHLNGTESQVTTVDSSASGHLVQVFGNAKLTTLDKKFGSASLLLDGAGDYLKIPDSTDFDIAASATENWTVDLWVRHDVLTLEEWYFCQFEDNNNRIGLFKLTNNRLAFQVTQGAALVEVLTPIGTMTTTGWHHIAMCKVGSDYGIYLDGTQVGYTNSTNTRTFAADLFIGQKGNNSRYMSGKMDEFRIQKRNNFSAAPNVGLTDTIVVPTSEASGGGTGGGSINMTLISESATALSAPSNARLVIFAEELDTIALNTDLKAYVSRDGGTTYTQITLAVRGTYESGKKILAGSVDISSQPSDTAMVSKIVTDNFKAIKLHGSGLFWD